MISTYFKNMVADVVWKTVSDATLPDTYYLALSSTEPAEDGTGATEPDTSCGYARVPVTALSSAVDGVTSNSVAISWPKIITDGGIVSCWILYDAATDGNVLMSGSLGGSKHLDAGFSISILAGKLSLNVREASVVE